MSNAWLFILAVLTVIMFLDLLIIILMIKLCRLLGCCDVPDTVDRDRPANGAADVRNNVLNKDIHTEGKVELV
jgi:hypothetical protein